MLTPFIDADALIFDDHKVFAGSFSCFLESLKLFRSVHCFTNDSELTGFIVRQSRYRSAYLFVDYYLPEKNGLSVVNEVRRFSKSVKIIVLSSVINPIIIQDIIEHKPDGFLSKAAGLDEVVEAVKVISRGGRFVSPEMETILSERRPGLSMFTDREKELLSYFAKGFTIEATANRLYLSAHTVIAHRKKMMKKANCKSILELLALAREGGII